MKNADETPNIDDFVKTLAVILLAEYAAVTVSTALRPYLSSYSTAFPLGATVIALMQTGLLLAVLGTNIASMFCCVLFRKDPGLAPFAMTSLALTGAQTVLLVASVAFGPPLFALVASSLTAAALVAIYVSPGK